MATTHQRLLGLRPLQRYLRTRIGEIDLSELRGLADDGMIPAVRLRGTRGHDVYAFDGAAVEAALLQLARYIPDGDVGQSKGVALNRAADRGGQR